MNTEPLLVVGAVALIAGSLERTGVKGGAGTGLREKAGEGARFGSGNRGARGGSRSARWAGRRDLNKLAVRAPEKGRVIVGKAGRSLIAAEAGQSVLVVGPTQSRKTTGFAIPALLEWQGPVVAASVKSDLLSQTIEWRGSQGRTWIYDPTRSTGRRCSSWSPIDASKDWAGSRRTAASLTEVARSSAGTLTDGDFWYATAAKLLAPLLLAASVSGGSMSDVVRWVDLQDVEEVESALSNAGEWAALQAAQATWARDPRQRSAVYSTAETVVDPFADPSVAATSRRDASSIDPVSLLGGSNTLYICS
ncbi:MAG TPA: type IV secretory system conjugative DNA transfer family protein, partial [Acidimicrobiales bacterium]|nr:type IV secretory system conjugative DNA transfer family protein [Acidimicrobiales bacterium]